MYRLNFEIFETKTRFFNFLAEKGLNKDTDIKNITKVEKDGNTVISMEVKSALLNKINGQQYNGKQVVFTPLWVIHICISHINTIIIIYLKNKNFYLYNLIIRYS